MLASNNPDPASKPVLLSVDGDSALKQGTDLLDSGRLFNPFNLPPQLPLSAIDFELAHSREHLSKLKFSWLELRTKQTFLERLLELSQDEWTALPVQWSPADIRSFEQDAVEPLKADLKRTKQQQQDLKQEVQAVAERIGAKHRQLERLAHARTTQLERIQGKQRELAELRAAFTGEAPPEASVAELADALGNLQAQVTKVRVDLQARQTAVQELGRLHLLCEEECQRQRDSLQVLEAECQALETRARGRPNLAALLQWHRLMLSLTQAAMPFVVRVDTVRSDYLLVTLGNGAELHVGLDAATGRLVSVRGLNDAALVARAIEYNDLGHLLRSLSASS